MTEYRTIRYGRTPQTGVLTLRIVHLSIWLSLAFCVCAHGAGMTFQGIGTEAAARGGAYVAKADGGDAFIYNPAGLSCRNKRHLWLNLQLVHLKMDYQRSGRDGYLTGSPSGSFSSTCPAGQICVADPGRDYSITPAGTPFSPVHMSRPGILPAMAFTLGNALGVDGLALSLGMTPPSGFAGYRLPENGAQRYALIRNGHFIVYPGVGVSYRFNSYFRAGVVFIWGIAHLSQTQKIRPLPSLASTSFNESQSGDALLEISAMDRFVPTANAGVLFSPVHWLEAGLSVRLPVMIDAAGNMTYRAPTQDMAASFMPADHDEVRIRQHFPLVVRSGLRVIRNAFDVELDVVIENWASLKRTEIIPNAVIRDPIDQNTFTDTPMPGSEVPRRFRNAVSWHLGTSFQLMPNRLKLHGGLFYQTSAYPADHATFLIDAPFSRQLGTGLGVTVQTGRRGAVHASWLHIFQPDVTVTQGIVQQQGLPLSTGENIGNIINNGTYQVALNIIGVSGELRF
ncbi:MAG: outer membrane protein transport protein [Deltaproteobacteria bacterium]|nr:outer membrane protein transport protein [Deltaproteobacteria bacterium]